MASRRRSGTAGACWRSTGRSSDLHQCAADRRRATKARTRRGRAAFAKMPAAVFLEVGLHNPVAAAVGQHGESEGALARTLFPAIPAQALVLANRCTGSGAVAASLHAGLHARGQSLSRARANGGEGTGRRAVARWQWRAASKFKPRYRPTPEARTLTVREIQVRVARAGQRAARRVAVVDDADRPRHGARARPRVSMPSAGSGGWGGTWNHNCDGPQVLAGASRWSPRRKRGWRSSWPARCSRSSGCGRPMGWSPSVRVSFAKMCEDTSKPCRSASISRAPC